MFERAVNWVEDRSGIISAVKPVLKHPVPRGSGWSYVFGSATLVSFIVLVATGIALATGYTASTADAYHSLTWISHSAILGRELRGMHYFAASAMVVMIGVHVIQVYLIGSYKYPREINWLVGVVLFALTLIMAFTGQLLRWDQNALWSIDVAAEQAGRTPFIGGGLAEFILGGNAIGGQTLTRFFAFHVFFIPAVIFGAIGFHLFLVVRNGVSEPPKPGRVVDPKTYKSYYNALLKREGVPFWPDAAWRDVVFAVGVVAVIIVLAIIFGAPELGKPPDPTILQAAPAPDWYFLWYFAALAQIPNYLQVWVIIGGPLLLGVLMIILPFVANKGERSPLRRPWAVGVVVLVVIIISTLLYSTRESAWVPVFHPEPLPARVIGATSGPVYRGAQVFHSYGCEFCHSIGGFGGHRGPDLTYVADRLTRGEITIRILNGGINMPAFSSILKPRQLDDLVTFLLTRKKLP
jgi:ubiquinol-cytochrome c reductase cytochrome b subunit